MYIVKFQSGDLAPRRFGCFNVGESSLKSCLYVITGTPAEICSLFKRMHYLNAFCRAAVRR